MKDVILQLVMAFMGSLGFSMIFRLRRSLWITGSLGGALCWECYLLMFDVTQHIFASGLVASAFAAVYAEIFARKKMAPTLLFVIPSVASQIPVLLRDIPVYSDWLEENRDVYKGRDNQEFKERIEEIL